MDSREIQGMGLGRAHRNVSTCCFPRPKSACSKWSSPPGSPPSLQEPPVAVDPTSNQQSEQLPSYNAYSIDGDVTAPLVFVNYGLPEGLRRTRPPGRLGEGRDRDRQYGNSWRGIKPKVAAEHGAIGCLIYSDPADDGYFVGRRFPERADASRRRRAARQRDGFPAPVARAIRSLPVLAPPPMPSAWRSKTLPSLTKIPVLPISYGDAQPLLAALAGPVAPEEWRGALANYLSRRPRRRRRCI